MSLTPAGQNCAFRSQYPAKEVIGSFTRGTMETRWCNHTNPFWAFQDNPNLNNSSQLHSLPNIYLSRAQGQSRWKLGDHQIMHLVQTFAFETILKYVWLTVLQCLVQAFTRVSTMLVTGGEDLQKEGTHSYHPQKRPPNTSKSERGGSGSAALQPPLAMRSLVWWTRGSW